MYRSTHRRKHFGEVYFTGKVQLESLPPTSMTEVLYIDDSDDDMESYEPGDFNVQVISASESEDEPAQDLNPDLELVCESDQEGRDDGDIVSKPEMDLKIVQIDFEQADEPVALIAREAENKSAVDRFDCPECYRWFSSPSSLRVHRMWHGVHKRRQQTQGQSVAVYACDTCGHEASSFEAHCHHIQTHTDQKPKKKNLTCSECGKVFSRLSALVSHQLHHPKRKQFQCPDCTMSYLHSDIRQRHLRRAEKNDSVHRCRCFFFCLFVFLTSKNVC
uniref:C2H2-type domain-containing protein n=1 Tax=Amphilophus citrinellus TaxID=61819 RepID=A0A3Q0QUV8_AMPCI